MPKSQWVLFNGDGFEGAFRPEENGPLYIGCGREPGWNICLLPLRYKYTFSEYDEEWVVPLEADIAEDRMPDSDFAFVLHPCLYLLADELSAIKFFVLDRQIGNRTGEIYYIICCVPPAVLLEQMDKAVSYLYNQACNQVKEKNLKAAFEFLIIAMRSQPRVSCVPLLLAQVVGRIGDFSSTSYFISYLYKCAREADTELAGKNDDKIARVAEDLFKKISKA